MTLYLFYLGWLQGTNYFGAYHDDALHFSSARALAEGRSYIIPSLPGSPPQTKLPVLYPWLLSWIWRWRPFFPANLLPAVWITAFFGCWFLLAVFVSLRKLSGFGDWMALVLVGLCAFQPQFLSFSATLMSDVPFMALAWTAMLAADCGMRKDGRSWAVVAAAILAGLSVGMRGLGVAVMMGIIATAVHRRAYRRAAIFSLLAVPFLLFFLSWSSGLDSSPRWEIRGPAPANLGWRQTLLYYTSYWGFWRITIPRPGVFLVVVTTNLQGLLARPATYFLSSLVGGDSWASAPLCAIITAGIAAGIVRQARRQEWKPIHFVFPFYSAILLVWNFPIMDRALLLFLPLFYAGLWVEGKHLGAILLGTLRSARPTAEKALAGVLSLGVLALAAAVLWNYLDGSRPQLRALSLHRGALLREKLEAYDWLRQHTQADARIVAYEDATLFLYTGRKAIPPIAFSPEWLYTRDPRVLHRDLAHITDAAQQVGARFWVTADDDFVSTGVDHQLIERRMAQLKSVLPLVFHSRENKVQIYDLSCLLQRQRAECQALIHILSPDSPTS